MKGNKCSVFRIFDISVNFPYPISLLVSFILACVFIEKAIIMKFSEDLDMGILYLSTKFELTWSTNNGNLLSDKNHLKHRQTDTQTESILSRNRI